MDKETVDAVHRQCGDVAAVSDWIVVEGLLLFGKQADAKGFIDNAWGPMCKFTKITVARMDVSLGTFDKIMADSKQDREIWGNQIKSWHDFRDATLTRLALLAWKAGRPDLVKSVFEFSGPLGKYKTSEQFLTDVPDPSDYFQIPKPPALTPEQEAAVLGVIEKWLEAAKAKNKGDFEALYETPGAADRLIEAGVFKRVPSGQVVPRKGKLYSSRIADGSILLDFVCPVKDGNGMGGAFRYRFILVQKEQGWRIRVQGDSGLSVAEEQGIKQLVGHWFEYLTAGDVDKAAGLYADSEAARAFLSAHIGEMKGRKVDLREAEFVFSQRADGSVAVGVDRIKYVDPSGKSGFSAHNCILTRQNNEFKISKTGR